MTASREAAYLASLVMFAVIAACGSPSGQVASSPGASQVATAQPSQSPTATSNSRTRLKGQFNFRIEGHAAQIGANFTGDLDENLVSGAATARACRIIAASGTSRGTLRLPRIVVVPGETYGLRIDAEVSGYTGPGTYGPPHFATASMVVLTNQSVRDVEAEFQPPASEFTLTMAADGSGNLVVAGRNAMVTSQAVSGVIEWNCANTDGTPP